MAIFNVRVTYNGQEYPDLAIAIGWMTAMVSIIWIPIYMAYHLIFKEKGTFKEVRIKDLIVAL